MHSFTKGVNRYFLKTPKNTLGVKVSMNGVLKIFFNVVRKQESIQENKVYTFIVHCIGY